MPSTMTAKAERYRALHAGPAFVAGGCWDAGTARLLVHAGMPCLETSSAGVMFARGLPDGDGLATREIMLANARDVAVAVDVPVTADLENGWAATPDGVAETIRQAGATGIVGGSIEDTTGDRADPIWPLDVAVARLEAAVAAARALPFTFALTARADQYMHGRRDIQEVIARAQAFQLAGADMIMAPGVSEPQEIAALCDSVDIPVAAIVGLSDAPLTLEALGRLGVRRVIVGSAFARVAMAGVLAAARETAQGTFGFTQGLVPFGELNGLFRQLSSGK
ncbi:MAG: isocitrate lyase/phosphoenolpyruvate mutase family protein [Acetobacteraceae bacterium]